MTKAEQLTRAQEYIEILEADIKTLEDDLSNSFEAGKSIGSQSLLDDDDLTQQILKAGFRQIAKSSHPDRGGDSEKMARINEWKENAIANGLMQ